MPRTSIDFGIDLGTTNSSIAVIDEVGQVRIIPNRAGAVITPSAVWIDKRGKLHVGQEAKLNALVSDTDNATLEFKQRMGKGVEANKNFVRSGREMTPEELSAEVLKSLKSDARSNMGGEEVHNAVITVPACFENPSNMATERAARLAGITQSPLQLEPIAAALAYGFQSEKENVYWFVYDFGGGTFDAAIVRVRDGHIDVVDHDGDNNLGGKEIDWEIVTKVLIPVAKNKYGLSDFRRGNPAIATLKYFAELAKIEVCCTKAPAEVFIEDWCKDSKGNSIDFLHTLTPDDVKQLSKPFIAQSLSKCRNVLEKNGLKGSSMERIVMVGGATLNPWVRDAVQTEFGSRLEFGIDPITVVARGAAIYASMQPIEVDESPVPPGTWRLDISSEYKSVGSTDDPDIGGRVCAPSDIDLSGYTIEFSDSKTKWKSGRITLGSNGAFLTRLYIPERSLRHWYQIELCDPVGSRISTLPDRVPYTLGTVPNEHPPIGRSIGIGQSDGSVATYIKKGTGLPYGHLMDHYTTIPLRRGNPNDILRISLLEGEYSRAERNHCIGTIEIKGSDLQSDLPVGSQLEIEVRMDKSQQITINVLVTALDVDVSAKFDSLMSQNQLHELRKQAQDQKARLKRLDADNERILMPRAIKAISQIREQQMLQRLESLLEAAETDQDAHTQLDRRLRELSACIDEIEDAAEWPLLLENAEEARSLAENIIASNGEPKDRNRINVLKDQLSRAIHLSDPDLLRRNTNELVDLRLEVLNRLDGFHLICFDWLVEQVTRMRDRRQAEQLIARGRSAQRDGKTEEVKAVNRQLRALLPIVDPPPVPDSWNGIIKKDR